MHLRNAVVLASVLATILIVPASALAAGAPVPNTNQTQNQSGTVTRAYGAVNPEGAATTAHFAYDTINSAFCVADGQSGVPAHTTADQSVGSGTSNAVIVADLTGLTPGTQYCVAVFASNANGSITSYPDQFTAGTPDVYTDTSQNIGATTTRLSGAANAAGQPTTLSIYYALQSSDYCQNADPTAAHSTATGPSFGYTDASYHDITAADLSGLTAGTAYCAEIVATNTSGTTAHGPSTYFTAGAPDLYTNYAQGSGPTTEDLYGDVNPAGQATTVHFLYAAAGTVFCDSNGNSPGGETATADQSVPAGTNFVPVHATVPNLTTGGTYCWQIVATHAGDPTVYTSGYADSFLVGAPLAYPTNASNVAATAATLNGVVNAAGSATTASFQFAPSSSAWCTNYGSTGTPQGSVATTVPTDTADHQVSANITGLLASTQYCFTVTATNSAGTASGEFANFTTAGPPSQSPTPTPTATATASPTGTGTGTNTTNNNTTTTTTIVLPVFGDLTVFSPQYFPKMDHVRGVAAVGRNNSAVDIKALYKGKLVGEKKAKGVAAGSFPFQIKFAKKVIRALRHKKSMKVKVVGTVTPPEGTAVVKSVTITVKRGKAPKSACRASVHAHASC